MKPKKKVTKIKKTNRLTPIETAVRPLEQMTIQVFKDQKAELKKKSESSNIPMQDFIREALDAKGFCDTNLIRL